MNINDYRLTMSIVCKTFKSHMFFYTIYVKVHSQNYSGALNNNDENMQCNKYAGLLIRRTYTQYSFYFSCEIMIHLNCDII